MNLRTLWRWRCFSINFINILPASFIEKFRFGIINAHAGDLPRYRGNACPNWAILNEESDCTFHEMNEILDGGDLIRKKYFILKDTYIGEVYEWTKWFLKGLSRGKNAYRRLYYKKKKENHCEHSRHPEDARLDFHESGTIHKLIRASKPFLAPMHFKPHRHQSHNI